MLAAGKLRIPCPRGTWVGQKAHELYLLTTWTCNGRVLCDFRFSLNKLSLDSETHVLSFHLTVSWLVCGCQDKLSGVTTNGRMQNNYLTQKSVHHVDASYKTMSIVIFCHPFLPDWTSGVTGAACDCRVSQDLHSPLTSGFLRQLSWDVKIVI